MLDLNYQKKLTVIYTVGFFILVLSFIGLFVFADKLGAASLGAEGVAWAQGVLGTLIGLLTAELPKQLQFWYGSSLGSKAKDEKANVLKQS